MRWTVDTPEDMKFACRIYEHFGDNRFSWTDILSLLREQPELMEINKDIVQKVI